MKKNIPVLVWAGHTAAGYLTFFAISTWLPLGLHRLVMRRGRWWLFPALFSLFAVGLIGFSQLQSPAWALLIAPYGFLLINDGLSMWAWQWPFLWTIGDKLRELNARYHMALLIGLAIVMYVVLWLATVVGSAK